MVVVASHSTNVAAKFSKLVKLCCKIEEMPKTNYDILLMDDNTNNLISPTSTITDIGSITQHTTSPYQIYNIEECMKNSSISTMGVLTIHQKQHGWQPSALDMSVCGLE